MGMSAAILYPLKNGASLPPIFGFSKDKINFVSIFKEFFTKLFAIITSHPNYNQSYYSEKTVKNLKII